MQNLETIEERARAIVQDDRGRGTRHTAKDGMPTGRRTLCNQETMRRPTPSRVERTPEDIRAGRG